MFETNSRQRVVEHGAVAFRHGVEPAREVGELADVIAGDALVAIGAVVMRGGVVRRADIQERVKEPRDVPAQQQRGDPRLVRLECRARRYRTSASCARGCLPADRSRAAFHGERDGGRRVAHARFVRLVLHRPCEIRFSTSRTLVRYSSSFALSPELTWRLSPSACSLRGPECSGSACCLGCRRDCRTQVTDRLPSAPARWRLCHEMCELYAIEKFVSW